MKFFIATRPSLNIVLMHSLEGQGDNKDFFANTFSNSIAPPKSMSLKILNFIFETARKPANDLPVSQLAEWHSNGTKVNDVFSPKRIILVPDQSVRNVIPQDTKEDFRVSLSKILPGTVLYQMFGMDENNNKVYMGKFISDSKFVSSKFGDKNLFFQHQR